MKRKINNIDYEQLPNDEKALNIEGKNLWYRASMRWMELMLVEKDALRGEAIFRRLNFCIFQAKKIRTELDEVLFTYEDCKHIKNRAKKLGCSVVSKYWID